MVISQWTYVYWDFTFYIVMRQTPDPLHAGLVISKVIDRGYHSMPWTPNGSPSYYENYAKKQIEIGQPYATQEWPLRTCQGQIIEGNVN